jgi:Antitoxin-like ribbon-helix-helix
LAVVEDTTVQDLLAEALNMLFQSRGLPMIAVMSRDQATSLTSRKPLEPASADGK